MVRAMILTLTFMILMSIPTTDHPIPLTDQVSDQPIQVIEPVKFVSRGLPRGTDGSFKSFMDFRMITDKTSDQWKLQQKAKTNRHGIRTLDGRPMVAVGTYYAKTVGKILKVTLEDGHSFEVVVGDIKQDRHTDDRNQYGVISNDIIEFIVDMDQISRLTMRLGSVSEYHGAIIKIEERLD